ncbi:MAG: hypothetical protein JSR21_06635 [Proteobacteria bacterium]|nr:hypothetical protein [Pseudomonadota bacterium]
MSTSFRSRPAGIAPGGNALQENRTWRPSAASRKSAAPAVWAVAAAIVIVAACTAGLHLLFQ